MESFIEFLIYVVLFLIFVFLGYKVLVVSVYFGSNVCLKKRIYSFLKLNLVYELLRTFKWVFFFWFIFIFFFYFWFFSFEFFQILYDYFGNIRDEFFSNFQNGLKNTKNLNYDAILNYFFLLVFSAFIIFFLASLIFFFFIIYNIGFLWLGLLFYSLILIYWFFFLHCSFIFIFMFFLLFQIFFFVFFTLFFINKNKWIGEKGQNVFFFSIFVLKAYLSCFCPLVFSIIVIEKTAKAKIFSEMVLFVFYTSIFFLIFFALLLWVIGVYNCGQVEKFILICLWLIVFYIFSWFFSFSFLEYLLFILFFFFLIYLFIVSSS
jgi:hypothetical protein